MGFEGPASLELDAADGWQILNIREPDPTPEYVALATDGCDTVLRKAIRALSGPTGRYNCHGLVFAARRTNIDSPDLPVDIDNLLGHDAYVQVAAAAPGDVIVYRSERGVVDHTGRVVFIGELRVVWVWSMWGGLGEFLHAEKDTPYSDCSREYWRITP